MPEEIVIKTTKQLLATYRDFVIKANQVNYESEIAEYVVPSKRVLEIPNDFIGLKLMTGEEFSFATGAGENSKTLTTTYNIVKDPLLPLAPPNSGAPACVIVRKVSPAPENEWTNFTVTLPRTITLNGLTASTNYVFRVYYLFDVGNVKITILSADETAKKDILTSSIFAVNSLNQENIKAGLKPGSVGQIIPERYKVQLKVKTPAPVYLFGSTESGRKTPWARVSYLELPVLMSNEFEWKVNVDELAKSQMLTL